MRAKSRAWKKPGASAPSSESVQPPHPPDCSQTRLSLLRWPASSGMTVLRDRKRENRSALRMVCGAQFSAHVGGEPVTQVKAKPEAFSRRLGGEERFEQFLHRLRFDAGPVIAHRDANKPILALNANLQSWRIGVLHGVDGILNEVHDDLVDRASCASHPQLAGKSEGDVRLRPRGCDDPARGRLNGPHEVDLFNGAGLSARKAPEILNDFTRPGRAFQGAFDEGLHISQSPVDFQFLA